MTTHKEDQMRAAFEHHILNIAPINLSRCDDGDYCDMVIDARWMDWKACAESYEKKLAEKEAEYLAQRAAAKDNKDWFVNLKIDYDTKCKQLSEANARNAMLVEALETADRNLHWRVSKIDQETITAALEFNSEAVAAWKAEKLLAQRTGCVCKDANGNDLNQCNECPR